MKTDFFPVAYGHFKILQKSQHIHIFLCPPDLPSKNLQEVYALGCTTGTLHMDYWFSSLIEYKQQLTGLLKYRFLDPFPNVSDSDFPSDSDYGWGQIICISYEFRDDTNAAALGITL